MLGAVFVYSAFQIFSIISSRQQAKNHYNTFTEFVYLDSETPQQNSTSNSKNNNSLPIIVDLEGLVNKYPCTAGWLYINENISYPVMQGSDNSYYLTHLPDGTENSSGSIFADFRNNSPQQDDNYIVYGHNMKNNTMFGSLDEYYNQDYFDNYPCYYFLTTNNTYRVDLVAGFKTNSDHYIYNIDFDNQEISQIINQVKKNSTFTSNVEYKKGDKLMTLSTCTNSADDERFVLIGILSEQEKAVLPTKVR